VGIMMLVTPAIIWLILVVVLLAVEAATLGLTTIWFAGGAVAAFIAACLGLGVLTQLIIFVALSCVLLVVTRPLAVRYMKKDHTRTNADSLVGQSALVTKTIDNLAQCGEVMIADVGWIARNTVDDSVIPAGSKVKICAIEGVKLMVEMIKEEE
jgi:membrane protein implicated in regulation of membrane protease activity